MHACIDFWVYCNIQRNCCFHVIHLSQLLTCKETAVSKYNTNWILTECHHVSHRSSYCFTSIYDDWKGFYRNLYPCMFNMCLKSCSSKKWRICVAYDINYSSTIVFIKVRNLGTGIDIGIGDRFLVLESTILVIFAISSQLHWQNQYRLGRIDNIGIIHDSICIIVVRYFKLTIYA